MIQFYKDIPWPIETVWHFNALLTEVLLERLALFPPQTCVKTCFKKTGKKMLGSSSCTKWVPNGLFHTQMIYVWLYVSLGNHQNRASLFNLFFSCRSCTHTHTYKKYLNLNGRLLDQCTRLTLWKVCISILYHVIILELQ